MNTEENYMTNKELKIYKEKTKIEYINDLILALAKGYNVKKDYWPDEDYIYIKNGKIVGSWGQEHFIGIGDFDDNWEIY